MLRRTLSRAKLLELRELIDDGLDSGRVDMDVAGYKEDEASEEELKDSED